MPHREYVLTPYNSCNIGILRPKCQESLTTPAQKVTNHSSIQGKEVGLYGWKVIIGFVFGLLEIDVHIESEIVSRCRDTSVKEPTLLLLPLDISHLPLQSCLLQPLHVLNPQRSRGKNPTPQSFNQ